MRLTIAICTASLLSLAACGGGGDDGTPQPARPAFTVAGIWSGAAPASSDHPATNVSMIITEEKEAYPLVTFSVTGQTLQLVGMARRVYETSAGIDMPSVAFDTSAVNFPLVGNVHATINASREMIAYVGSIGPATLTSSSGYNTPLNIATRAYSGLTLDGHSVSANVIGTSINGSSAGCAFNGSLVATGKAYNRVSVTFGNQTACLFPNQRATGIAAKLAGGSIAIILQRDSDTDGPVFSVQLR